MELAAQNALLRRQVAELSARIAKQDERIAELERHLNRNSRNSSLPPSLDPPTAPGHCFSEAERRPVGEPARHQVVELPAIAVLLSEHCLQRLRCPECGAVTRAALPAAVPRGAFGPRLQAAVVTLAVRNRVSRRDTTELLRELFGACICAGSVEAILQHAATALDEPYEDLLCHVCSAAALNIEKDRLAPARRQAHALGHAHRPRRGLPHRRGSSSARGPGLAR